VQPPTVTFNEENAGKGGGETLDATFLGGWVCLSRVGGAGNLLDYNCGARTYDTGGGYNHSGVDIYEVYEGTIGSWYSHRPGRRAARSSSDPDSTSRIER